jgi:5-methylcytosine-specific restriction endonuclease McrA
LKGVHNPHIVGDKNPNWKGGVTKVQAQLRKCYKYRTWRREVFERDNYTCVECGTRGGDKNADHYPISFAQHLRRIQEENDGKLLFENALKDTSLWDINNGRTLCIGCHKETDNYLKPITT